MIMRHIWIFAAGLILLISSMGCVTSPGTFSGITPIITPTGPGTVAQAGNTVSLYYTVTLDDGMVIDSNVNSTPLEITLGKGMLNPEFEAAVLGMGVNESKTVFIPFQQAYGAYNTSLIHTIPRSVLGANMTPVVGQYLTITRKTDGAVSQVKIINVTSSSITWDENNELAGKNLTFSIRIAGIK
jgi:peptidylprolyl isomerase